MRTSLPHPVRVHGRGPYVVAVLLLALISLARPAHAAGSPVDPVPVGVWPLQPTHEVVRTFDPPDVLWGAGHRGVDLAGVLGQAVDAALLGRVSFAGQVAGKPVVVVDHGATRTTYQPVRATVHVGQIVLPGQQIGTLQLVGSHCLPRVCLHWGWIRGDTYLDPLLLVGGGPIRLLPLWRDEPVAERVPTNPSLDLWRTSIVPIPVLLPGLGVVSLADQPSTTTASASLLQEADHLRRSGGQARGWAWR